MADMVRLVAGTSSPAYRGEDLPALADLFAFNLLIAGVDGHAKNHSILHVGSTSRLAPAYDLISAHGIWPENRVRHRSSAAVKYGKERPYRKISGRNIARTADVLGVPRGAFVGTLDRMSRDLPGAFDAGMADVPDDMVTEQLRAMPARIETFANDFVHRVHGEDVSLRSLPLFEGARAIGRPARSRIWEPGERRGHRWITGRYRNRPSR